MTYEVVYYVNGKRIIRNDFDDLNEAKEYAEACTQGYEIKHVVEEHVVTEKDVKDFFKNGILYAGAALISLIFGGYGRRD